MSMSSKCVKCARFMHEEGQPVLTALCALSGGRALDTEPGCEGPFDNSDFNLKYRQARALLEEACDSLRHPEYSQNVALVAKIRNFLSMFKD